MTPGSLKFAQYAFSPNQLKLCGPRDKNQIILDYLSAQRSDPGLIECLEEFEAAFPYISFIAKENRIKNPFAREVVEAYWLGNQLLDQIPPGHFYRFLKEQFKSYLKPDQLRELKETVRQRAKPSHNFHVFKVFPMTGGMRGGFKPSLKLLDNCRISWGEVIKKENDKIIVNRSPLIVEKNQIRLGSPEKTKQIFKIEEKGFLDGLEPGAIVSIHWEWVCDQINKRELNQLSYWTRQAFNQINQGLSLTL